MRKNTVMDLSYASAIRIINLGKTLQVEKKEYTISKQVTKSGTSIGALVREAHYAESPKDFIHKMAIAL
jgi:four helix bundle protein